MLSWFFKKWKAPAAPLAAPVTPAAARAMAQQAVQAKAEVRARQSADALAQWQARLQAAVGDDEALLAVARSATVLDIKLAAVQALGSEPALVQAEREFRSHDRRVHRVAKQRLESAVAQRSTQTRAQALIASAQTLLDQDQVAVNHLVVLDRDWQALDPAWTLPPQQVLFTDLRQRIASAVHSQSGQQQVLQRWLTDAAQAREALRQDCASAAAEASSIDLTAHHTLIAGLQAACPAAPAATALAQALASALQTAALLPERLELLAGLEQPEPVTPVPVAATPAPEGSTEALPSALADAEAVPAWDAVPAPQPTPTPTPTPTPINPAERWRALATLPDPALADLLTQRFARWQRGQPTPLAALAPEAATTPARRPPQAKPGKASPQGPTAEQADRLDALLLQAEAALAEGQLGPLQQNLQAFDAALAAMPGVTLAQPSGESLRNRLQALHTERSRLKDWQQWGGGRAREDLLAEAEALARLTLAAAGTPAPPPAAPSATSAAAPAGDTAGAEPPADLAAELPAELPVDSLAETPTELPAESPAQAAAPPATAPQPQPASGTPAALVLNLKIHGDAIQALRNRWKALDRLGAAASQALWQGFDAALHTAYQPLALRQAAIKAARQDNLLAREALLAELAAWPAPPGVGSADAASNPAANPASNPPTQPPTHPPTHPTGSAPTDPKDHSPSEAWKTQLRALDRFHTAWRQLGPLEHTVPAAARDGLSQRHRQALDRIELPLQVARSTAAARREQLIEQAQALTGGSASAPAAYDAPQQVRSLQAEWQQQARLLPLARSVENALWARFKAATDAVFLQRDAAQGARDAELVANLAEREAWLQRLAVLAAEPSVDLAPEPMTNTDPDTPPRSEHVTEPSADPQRPDHHAAAALRTLAEIDRAWRQAVDLPRGAAAALEARYRQARNAVQLRLTAATQQRWQAGCDALVGRLALCAEREGQESHDGGEPRDPTLPDAASPLDLAARWAALPGWPGACDDALARRWVVPLGTVPKDQPEVDSWLLALEVALNLPAGPAQQAARQQLKLLALKNALEGRSPSSTAPQRSPLQSLAAVLGQAGLSGAQRKRLQAVLAALRQAPAGALGLVLPPG